MKNRHGNTLIYAIILINIAIIVAYIIFTKSSILLENASMQVLNAKLNKNIQEKAMLSIKYDQYLNSNGSGFVNTISCPANVTLSGSVTNTVIDSMTPYFNGTTLFCSGTTNGGDNLLLQYGSGFMIFSTGFFQSSTALLTDGSTVTGRFTDSDATKITFTKPESVSDIDSNFNSDDYRAYSTGAVTYPNGFADDDVNARKTIYGYVQKGIGWYNIFWNNAQTDKYIANNSNNNDVLNAKLSTTNSGYLLLDIDSPYTLQIAEFDSRVYTQTSELDLLGKTTYTSNSGAIGYIQMDGSLGGTGATVKNFDFQNKNYALFLSFSGSSYNPDQRYLKYKIQGINATGSGLYINPMDDSTSGLIGVLSNDIIIDENGRYISKQQEVTVAK